MSSKLYAEFRHEVEGEEGHWCEGQHERPVDITGDERGPSIEFEAPVPQVCPLCKTKLTKEQFAALHAEWERVREAEYELLEPASVPATLRLR